MSNEYYGWVRHGGQPPDNEERPDHAKAEWTLSACLTCNPLIREGAAPGDVPTDIAGGRAEYMGARRRRCAACPPSERIVGRGCRGRHGGGPKRIRYGPET